MPDQNAHLPQPIHLSVAAFTEPGLEPREKRDDFLIQDLDSGSTWTAKAGHFFTNSFVREETSLGLVAAVSAGRMAPEASELTVSWFSQVLGQAETHCQLKDLPFREQVRLGLEEANRRLYENTQTPELIGSQATFTGIGVRGANLVIAQVGDSRAHLFRNGKLVQVTKDQSLISQLLELGTLTREELESGTLMICQPFVNLLGSVDLVQVAIHEIPVCHNDFFLLSNSELTNRVEGVTLLQILSEPGDDLGQRLLKLIEAARQAGQTRGLTALLLEFSGNGLPRTGELPALPLPHFERDPRLPNSISLR